LDRIAEISLGNPRLAVMAAQVAIRENTLQSIRDVSTLYDEYFHSIRQDLQELEGKALLKVAGLIAFFRVVDRSDEDLFYLIGEAFNISAEEFWEAAERLHELELVDIYENEVVKIADQILAVYLFYLVF